MAEAETRVEEIVVRSNTRNDDEREGREEPGPHKEKSSQPKAANEVNAGGAPSRLGAHMRPQTERAPRRQIPQKELQLRRTVVALMKRQRAMESRLNSMKAREDRQGYRGLRSSEGILEPRGQKRDREEIIKNEREKEIENEERAAKRLRPQLVIPGSEGEKVASQDPKGERPQDPKIDERKPSANVPEVKSNKRLFGNLLFGTLKASKKEVAQDAQNEVIQKRTALLNSIEEKETKELEKRREERAEFSKEMRTTLEESLAEVNETLRKAKTELQEARRSGQDWLESGFLKTTAGPSIFFMPAKVDDFIVAQFGYKARVARKVEEEPIILDEESDSDENEGQGEDKEGGSGEVIVEEGFSLTTV